MSNSSNVVNNIEGYSAAMYSTWLYYRPARLLFDAGEGVSLTMRNFIFGIETVLISHGHYDHIGGLAGMIYSRASAMGDKEKPLTIYHPGGWDAIESFKRYIQTAAGHLKYELKWVEAEDGQEIDLGDGRAKAVAFKVQHAYNLCLGYKLVEDRVRLKNQFKGMAGSEIAKIVKEKGRDFINDTYRKNVLAYCGDSMPVRASSVAGVDVLIHEGTFVDVKDREKPVHSSVYEAVGVAQEAGAESLLITHVSGRYTVAETLVEARRSIQDYGYDRPVFLLANREMIRVD